MHNYFSEFVYSTIKRGLTNTRNFPISKMEVEYVGALYNFRRRLMLLIAMLYGVKWQKHS